MRGFWRVCLALSVLGLLGGAPASAQPMPPPPQPFGPPPAPDPAAAYDGHAGLTIGFSVGLGQQRSDCEGCESYGGLGFDFSIGGFLTPRLAILYDASGVISLHDDSEVGNFTYTTAVNAIALQGWLAPKLWIKAGLGVARAQLNGDIEAESDQGTGCTIAVGYEARQSWGYATDLAVRASTLTFDDVTITNFAATIGFHWF